MIAGGCETKSWFNPGEVGRYKHEPLLLPIVNSLSGETGIEEPNDQFAQASDVTADDLQSANQDYVVGKNDLLSISITRPGRPGHRDGEAGAASAKAATSACRWSARSAPKA